ncbi:hypothetical protein BGZ99_007231 [Dissophora globulifera]|uniref:SAP domain-containing protein n=1 Tax=Dissophora globulifera TaxID=979702 RepID=A0A9P6RBC4_9FUNG|nr:hypothetical protein BGZ99_007231 [Dissophora globulifera]
MRRIPCQQSTHWLAASLRPSVCTNARQHTALTGSRISRCNTTPSAHRPQPCFYSTLSAAPATPAQPASRKTKAKQTSPRHPPKAPALDAATLDSLSNALISDLYTGLSSKAKITLDDVLALRPASQSVTPEEFNKLKDVVATSFNVGQLKGVLRSQGVPANGKKSVLVNQIMVLMDLEIKAHKTKRPMIEDPYPSADSDVVHKAFPSNKRELFFILGSEGDSLKGLEREKNVRISINIANETYVIRGGSEAVAEAQDRIRELVAVTEDAWDISAYSERDVVMKDPSALEDIARRSETFVTAGEGNKLIIAGRSPRDMEEAKRLFDLRLYKATDDSEALTFLHQEDELKPLGMSPVYDSISMTLDENQKSYIRVSQTAPYADQTLDNPTIHPVHTSPASIGTLDQLRGYLKESMDGSLGEHQTLELSANFGQVLFANKNQRMTQLPLPGVFDTLDLEEWLGNAELPYFYQSLPFFKAVTNLPLISPKTRTIEAEYLPSSRFALSTSSHVEAASKASPLRPIRVTFILNNEGELCLQDGRTLNKQSLANLMMLSQPTDIQIRSELLTTMNVEAPSLKELLHQTTLPYANRLQCPSFFSFNDALAATTTPAVAQLGLGMGSSAPTHTLKTVLFRTSGIFDFHGLPLVASDIVDQHGHVRKQELKLLPVPLDSGLGSGLVGDRIDMAAAPSSSSATSSPLDHWDDFIKATLHLSRTL